MNLKEYQELAAVTCSDLETPILNLFHMTSGMSSELPEVLDALANPVDLSDELADIVWYVANYLRFRSISLEDYLESFELPNTNLKTNIDGFLSMTYWVGEITDLVKKHAVYGKEISDEYEHNACRNLLSSIAFMMAHAGIDYSLSLQKNIAKLEERFKGKFEAHRALNRDLAAEQKAMES